MMQEKGLQPKLLFIRPLIFVSDARGDFARREPIHQRRYFSEQRPCMTGEPRRNSVGDNYEENQKGEIGFHNVRPS